MPDIYDHIATTIRALRKAENVSQEALAAKIAEPANTVSRWETGTYKPSVEQLEKLSRHFDVSITVFFPNLNKSEDLPNALLSATRGLKRQDLDEVIRYAEFRRARAALRKAQRRPKPKVGREVE